MVIEIIAAAGVATTAYEYFHNAAFKADVQKATATVQTEVAALETKAKSGVAVVEADFAKAKTAVAAIVAKL